MSSKVDICNQALSNLARNRISSFDDNTTESNECLARYDEVAEYVMGLGPWACNRFRSSLPQTTVTPAYGYQFAYQLPVYPKCLRLVEVNEIKPGDIDFQVEGNTVLSNETAFSIVYAGLLADPGSYDTYLKNAIIAQLTAVMAYKFTGQQTLAAQLLGYAEKVIDHQLTLSQMQGSSRPINSDEFIDVRRRNDTGNDGSNPIAGV